MTRTGVIALALGFSAAALAATPAKPSEPMQSPLVQSPPEAHWRSPFTPAPGQTPDSKADKDKQRPVAQREGMRGWHGLDSALARVRNALPNWHLP